MDALGFVNRKGVRATLARSMAGLVLLHPIINYIDALPRKMFEYMSAGIPVIASNFPLWKEIVEGNQCGLTVNPLSPEKIVRAIEHLITHPEKARRMGKNGQRAVLAKYNWKQENAKLLGLYKKLMETKK